MEKYMISEYTLNKAFDLLIKQENHWNSRARDMRDFPERAKKYEDRAKEIRIVIDGLLEAEYVG